MIEFFVNETSTEEFWVSVGSEYSFVVPASTEEFDRLDDDQVIERDGE